MHQSPPPHPLQSHSCPLCGGPNGCAAAAQGTFDTPCWCTQARFSPKLLARVPPAERGRACICSRCAQEGRQHP